ncbi:MAG: TonB C-terminal domain-containing protein [Sphingomonas sp.]|uniref:TonB C-terminal domain-containing protein n=1 Tax=Sphingomonas sp. TaxID=28214 RepID=UPI001B1CCCC2|nr:TonB C-terminal domain-containing protein [Sphingomonas sp.]MBO9624725.1 TonB C-terminal domain-containing protein [Sphingomonas sp.]
MTRSEAGALGIAAIGHLVLFGLLSVGFLATPNPKKLESVPIEVSLTDQVGLESQAPVPHHEDVAAKLSPVEAPIEPEVAPPEPVVQPEPQPIVKPQPVPLRPAPAPEARPAPKQPPAKPAPPAPAKAQPQPKREVRASGALEGIIAGLKDTPSESKATTPPAAKAGPAVQSALRAEVLRQIKPHWSPPSGADSDKLRTTVQVQLDRSGAIVGQPRVSQTGVTASNRVQADLHRERAIRAVRLAAPFKLPAQYYDAWKTIAPTLYEGL